MKQVLLAICFMLLSCLACFLDIKDEGNTFFPNVS
jgi:hypothetical protein